MITFSVFAVVPSISVTRLAGTIAEDSVDTLIEEDGRIRVWATVLGHFPEYGLVGIGYGNWHDTWAVKHGVRLAHNAYLQYTVYWGLAGLFPLIFLTWSAYRCLPKHCGRDVYSLFLMGLAICVLLRMLVSHNFADKDIAFALGMLVGAKSWIWPKGNIRYWSPARKAFPQEV